MKTVIVNELELLDLQTKHKGTVVKGAVMSQPDAWVQEVFKEIEALPNYPNAFKSYTFSITITATPHQPDSKPSP